MMHVLPPIELAGARVRLPLSQQAATGLVDALLVEAMEARAEGLVSVLRCEAPLALWVCCQAARAGSDDLTTAEALAAWLAPRLPALLPSEDYAAAATEIERTIARRMARLAERASHVAEHSLRLARKIDGTRGEQARLAGLLSGTETWFTLCGAGREARTCAALPAWLRQLVVGLSEREANSSDEAPLVGLVRRALVEARASNAAHRTTAGRNSKRWRLASAAEAARLASVADRVARLAALEARFAEMLETEKLEALAELAAGAGHEFNPPLAVISGRAQLFLREEHDAERRRELAVINRQALRVHEMIADLMHFARPAQPRPADCDVVALVREAISGLQTLADERRITLDFSASDDELFAEVDATQVQVAVRAVVTNALEAIGSEGRIEVQCAARSEAGEASLEIVVRDDGPGLTPEVRRHLFDPFYSGRGAGRGLGLGLSKCWRIVTNHGGRVDVESAPGAGTIVRLTLPVRQTGVIPRG
ncbi:MAG: hypothetical protein KF708_18285 [Pirellulales bacterium]|nr:hypothetical protein [Pirellulales bacterium]